jgi:hypothetical protein
MIVKHLKSFTKRLLGEQRLGMIDYFRHPEFRDPWGGPFNGQQARMRLFQSLIAKLSPLAIVETGTFHGITTGYMAATNLPVYTAESQARNYGFARVHLLRRRNVKQKLGDSRQFLRELFLGPLRDFSDKALFAYLDAHWYFDVPLVDEIDLVFSHCAGAIVMVDDFQVPFDRGYGYGDYRMGLALTRKYIDTVVRAHGLFAFYPSVHSSKESGARRGCVVLAKKPSVIEILASMPELRTLETVSTSGYSRGGQNDINTRTE